MSYVSPPLGAKVTSGVKDTKELAVDKVKRIGGENWMIFRFDHDWELMPGIWTFQIWSKNEIILEKKFVVIL